MNIDKLLRKKQHAKRNNNLQQLAEITRALGDRYFENKQPKKALQEYTEQLSICEDLQDTLKCAIAHRMIGEVHASLEDYEQALIHENLHLEGARNLRSLIEEQRAFATLGRTYFCLAESLANQSKKRDEALANAKTAYVKSMELCDKLTETEIELKEKTLMRARLLLNLGLILEAQKETQQAVDLIEQAATLCILNSFQEDLHRTCISLAAIYERQNNHELALKYIESASTVHDICLKAEAKILKAELLMRMGQWIEARKILISLYTTTGLSKDTNYQVEKYLRIVVTLCRAENDLLIETNYQVKQKLYETLGDAAVAVQCFDKAVEYYQHMLTCAEETNTQIGITLISLAKTLKDAGRYKEALLYAQRELELCTDSREKCRSALFLADLLIATDAADIEVHTYYTLALNSANESNIVKLRKTVVHEFVTYLENIGQFNEAKDVKEKAGFTADIEILSDTESDVSSQESDKIGADICLEDLSDMEIENTAKRTNVNKKRAQRKPAIKKNEKGETQLHIACINGDINAVERLLSSCHPINIKDHCGWSALHEAANHGYVEIVEILLKHGANINDPGGTFCKGVTPLHDAASCGHISIMQLLMQYGADITLKTQDGDTVLDYLEDWRDRVEGLNPEDVVEYETMHKQLSAVISTNKKKKKFGNIRIPEKRSIQSEVKELSAGEDYRRTISNIRSFNKIKSTTHTERCNDENAALIGEDQVLIDDWLEDDIEDSVKKATTSSDRIIKNKRKFADGDVENITKRVKINNMFQNENISANEDSNDSTATEVTELFEEPKRIKRKQQTSLISCGFTSRTPSPTHHIESLSCISDANYKQYNQESINLHICVKEKMFNLIINAFKEEKEFLVYITSMVEKMFYDETGCIAKLLLQPINGNVATKENILKFINKDTSVNNKLECKIVELQIPSIVERYKTICSTHNITPCESMLKCLKSCENTSVFRIKSEYLNKDLLIPLLKTLEYQKDIKVLQLSGTVLVTAGAYLYQCLSNLSSLQELYLKGCYIDSTYLRKINSLPSELRVLDLSYNPLSSESCESLQKLITPLQHLQVLNLRYCELEDFCLRLDNPNLINCDVSWNKLNRDSIASFLSRQLFDLNLSNTISFSQLNLALDTTSTILSSSLESLELSFCDITDFDVKTILIQFPRLLKLILGGNMYISILSINLLLSRQPTLTYIDVSGCKDIVTIPEAELVIQNPEICTLFVSIEPYLCDIWIKLWRGTGIVTKLPHNLAIFKPI